MVVARQPRRDRPIDRREVCVLHGWVGLQDFQRDRHDLCEVPIAIEPPGFSDDDEDDDELAEPEMTPFVYVRDGDRKRRRRDPKVARPHIISRKKRPQEVPEEDADLVEMRANRPKTRGDCADVIRPCPWVSCKHHLYLDINPRTGAIRITFPDMEPWELKESCALDVAAHGGITLDAVGNLMNLSRERIRQLESPALKKLKALERHLENATDSPETIWPDH